MSLAGRRENLIFLGKKRTSSAQEPGFEEKTFSASLVLEKSDGVTIDGR